jgi:hypothetical protein
MAQKRYSSQLPCARIEGVDATRDKISARTPNAASERESRGNDEMGKKRYFFQLEVCVPGARTQAPRCAPDVPVKDRNPERREQRSQNSDAFAPHVTAFKPRHPLSRCQPEAADEWTQHIRASTDGVRISLANIQMTRVLSTTSGHSRGALCLTVSAICGGCSP